MSAVFDLTNKYWWLATSGPPEIWQDHQISRTGGPMVHCLEMLISSPEYIVVAKYYICHNPSIHKIVDRKIYRVGISGPYQE